ncbi:hypothetical protein HY095_04365 [Candidatus Micrarchaeota archaeon]|nr:hypothetical protein [Candidatus Micrarchaeota archaeon]
MANNTDPAKGIFAELPHIVIVAALLVVLVFVATEFQWVHCSAIPQWCSVYCSVKGHSRVAVVYDPDGGGLGNALLLRSRIEHDRPYTSVVPIRSDEISAGVLRNYALVILTQHRKIGISEALSIRDYLKGAQYTGGQQVRDLRDLVGGGASLLWEGDAASEYVITDSDDSRLRIENATSPGSYESYATYVKNHSRGFGLLGEILGARLNATKAGSVQFKAISDTSPIVSGVKNFNLTTTQYAVVNEDPRLVNKIAVIKAPGGKEVPMLLERKFVGRIVYTAIPLELIDSKTLLGNVMDYLVSC